MDETFKHYQFGDFTLDVVRGCVLRQNEEVKLRPKLYEALKYLLEHPGQLIGKHELMKAVWPDSFVTEDSLVQCVLELRRALDDHNQQLIKTVPRRGYLLAAQVVPVAAIVERSLIPDAIGERPRLPLPRTALIGREQQLDECSQLLLRPEVRLLTLTGAGGAGKTRLSIAIASAVAGYFTSGAQFVSLAALTHYSLVEIAVADALRIQQVAHKSIAKLIAEQLQTSGPFLLVLDNFEHVLAAAPFISEVLSLCPALKILVTSRSCLRIYGEHEFPVAPLVPAAAVELFSQRAAAVLPSFTLTTENARTVQDICARLDGLPLAIELAAARTKVLSPRALLDRLESSLTLLTGGALDLPARQQTLRNTIEWSYSLLTEPEAKLFRRLAVFVGGCTVEAAEAVCNTARDLPLDLFEGLSSLVDKNLVQCLDRTASEPRFSMLQTIREYALELLHAAGEHHAARRAHAAYCLVLAEEGNPDLSAAQRSAWLAECDLDIDNFRFALDWVFETGNLDWGLRLSMALFRFWDMREHLAEGRSRLESILGLARNSYTIERAKISHFAGAIATAQGDYAAARQFLENGLALYEDLGDESGIAASLNALAVCARDRGDYAAAQANFERSLASWRMLSDRLETARCLHNLANLLKIRGDYARASWASNEASGLFQDLGDHIGWAWSINQQGDVARAQGDTHSARELYQRALTIFRKQADPWGIARSLTDLANIYCARAEYEAADQACREAVQIFAGLGQRRGVARALEAFACLALSKNSPERALKLAAAAAKVRQSVGAPLTPDEQQQLDQTLSSAWQSLSGTNAEIAWNEGFRMSVEESIRYCLDAHAAIA